LISPLLLLGQTPGRPGATWKVQKYAIEVTLPQDASRAVMVNAGLDLRNTSSSPAGTLTLRISPAAEVTGVKVNGASVDFSKNEEKINAASTLQRIIVRFPSIPSGGSLSAAVDYKLNVKENTGTSGVSPTTAQFLPLSFWYPTPNSWFFTQGADASPYRIKVNAPVGSTVLSSGAETGGAYEQKLVSQPFFLTGQWEVSTQNSTTIYAPRGAASDAQKRAAELAALFAEARTFTEGILGKAPDVPMRIVAVHKGAGYAGGGTILVDEGVFRRSKIDAQTAMNIAEAAAKLWLGNGVSVGGEGYGVITEGLSRYIATQFIENKFGKDVADIERLRQRNAYSAISKRDAPMATVSPLDDFYYSEVANKGAMAWRIIAKRFGNAEFANTLRANMQDGALDLAEVRAAFSPQKELLDYLFDQVTDTNLMIGLPQVSGSNTKVALRNTGKADVTVDVVATTTGGEQLASPVTLKATSFGEVVFKTAGNVTRVEIDRDKLYPQTEYADDVAPRESAESDPLLAAKRQFDKQDFVSAEATARSLLRVWPRSDDLRVFLGRSLLAQNKNAEAEREFRMVIEEKLPTARSLAWANVGLAEVAARSNQTENAIKLAQAAIMAEGEFGASLAARNLRNRLGRTSAGDAGVKSFFADFDRAASSNRKADVDALVMPGEVTKFASGVSGSTEQWKTDVRQIDVIDANTLLVEADMTVKLLNKSIETGMAVYRLTKAGGSWKLTSVEMFEVR
jgi:hypothetical protein